MLKSNSKRRRRERETSSDHHANNKANESKLKLEEINQVKKLEYLGFSRLLDLPSSIIIEILTRIPIDDILQCRCVCKTLCSLITDPSSVKDFFSRTPFLSIVLGSKHNFRFLKLGCTPNLALGYKKSKPININFIPNSYRSKEIIGCSNGLICFWDGLDYYKHKMYITNPVLGEFAVLPNPPTDRYTALQETYGFYFCPSTEQYKLIKIKTRRAFLQPNQQGYYRKTEVWILVVGSNTWRYVGDAPFPLCGRFCNVILNGCIHWIVDHDNKGPIQLHAMNITEEQAHPVPAPHELSYDNSGLELELGVMRNYLCFFDCSWRDHLDIWCMKEYGVATSWTKDRIITTSIRFRSLRPVAVEENVMIMMSDLRGPLFCYDPKEEKFTSLSDFRGDGRVQAVVFTPTFLSLKHDARGTCLKVKKLKSGFSDTYHAWPSFPSTYF